MNCGEWCRKFKGVDVYDDGGQGRKSQKISLNEWFEIIEGLSKDS